MNTFIPHNVVIIVKCRKIILFFFLPRDENNFKIDDEARVIVFIYADDLKYISYQNLFSFSLFLLIFSIFSSAIFFDLFGLIKS